MIEKALKYIVALNKPEILDIGGSTYSDKHLTRIPENLTADPLGVSTLTSLVEYIKSGIDTAGRTLLVQVESPTSVNLYSCLNSDANREKFIECGAFTPRVNLNSFVEQESFIIMLQSMFVRNHDSELVLRVAGNVQDETIQKYGDDGVSQKATIKTGIAKMEDVIVPNPVLLAPYRSFPEIDQPESQFVFRMKQGNNSPMCALYEADGGAWRNVAMNRIKEYLTEQLEGVEGITIIS